MALSSAERVNAWRQRLNMKARFFDGLNQARIFNLDFDPDDTRPEYLAVRHYIKNYPLAFCVPDFVELSEEEGGWTVHFERWEPIEAAVAAMAMLSVTSTPVFISHGGDGSGGMERASDLLQREPGASVKAEIEDMMRLGLWGAL